MLTLPEVTKERPTTEGGLLHTLSLDWRGRLLVLSLWMLP